MTRPIDIIAVFDKTIVAVFGENMARLYPHNSDKLTADRWIAMGATVPMCESVFKKTLETRKAKGLTVPFSLSYFENPMRDAVVTWKAPVEDDPETLQWKARVRGWMTNPRLWVESSWGSPPDQPHTRCPRHVRNAMGLECGIRH